MTVAGSFNAFSRIGRVVEDPSHVVWIEGADDDQKLGGHMGGETVETVADYLVHRTHGVTLGEQSEWYDEHGRPDVYLDTGEEVVQFTWDDDEEDYRRVDE